MKNWNQNLLYTILLVFSSLLPESLSAQKNIPQWGCFETSFTCKTKGNPFTEVGLNATFINNETHDTVRVTGFYDGNDIFKVRFMPLKQGLWTYEIKSSESKLNGRKGSLVCIKPETGNHGMVKVGKSCDFTFSDGGSYSPFGTTAYAWTHMDNGIQNLTLKSLAQSGFNKVRMCIFPKYYALVKEEPASYPYEIKSVTTDSKGEKHYEWDFNRFNPQFFQHLERRILQLDSLGIQADLILFHPYDKGHWGFDAMPMDANIKYIKYVVSRLAPYRNVWWSLANEFDYVKSKTVDNWITLSRTVTTTDPYKHLCSIHGSTACYFDYSLPFFTHASIQDQAPVSDFGRAATVRNIFKKPVIFDEVCYEGNLPSRWGQLSGEEMLYRIWQGLIAGTYVTHGECFNFSNGNDTIFWAKGGPLRGESWKRIAFTRKMIESLPNSLQLADMSWDNITSTAGPGYYFIYLGKETPDSWTFNLPAKNANYPKLTAGEKFKVEVIDTWNMTTETYPGIFETTAQGNYRFVDKEGKKVSLPQKPYLLLRITHVL